MSPPALPFVTSFYAGLLGILALALAMQVIRGRQRNRVSVGDGGNPEMLRLMRVQANFSEYVPLALLLIMLGEILGVPRWLVHGEGLVLLAARLLHAWGLGATERVHPGRFVGILATFAVIAVGSIVLIVRTLTRGIFG